MSYISSWVNFLQQPGVKTVESAMARKSVPAGMPTTFAELGIPADTNFRAIADSTNVTAGCCKKLSHDEIYGILCECK